MKLNDPETWPQRPDLFYRQHRARAGRDPISHAFVGKRYSSLCNHVSLDASRDQVPTKGLARVCQNCLGAMISLGWMPRSEIVEE